MERCQESSITDVEIEDPGEIVAVGVISIITYLLTVFID